MTLSVQMACALYRRRKSIEAGAVQVISQQNGEVFVNGLKSGELVVAELNNALFPGLAVKPKELPIEVQ